MDKILLKEEERFNKYRYASLSDDRLEVLEFVVNKAIDPLTWPAVYNDVMVLMGYKSMSSAWYAVNHLKHLGLVNVEKGKAGIIPTQKGLDLIRDKRY